jgi:hypothetical protein
LLYDSLDRQQISQRAIFDEIVAYTRAKNTSGNCFLDIR